MAKVSLEEFEAIEADLEARLKAVRAAKAAFVRRLLDDRVQSEPKSRTTTIKDEVLEILSEHPEGLTALEILAIVQERFRPELLRETLSPQLSRLKQAGKLTTHNKIWRAV